MRENTSQTVCWGSGDSAVMVGVYISTLSVKSYYPQKNGLIWALATVTNNGTTNSDRITNSSAEKKGTWNQQGQGLKMGVYMFLYNQILEAKINSFGITPFPMDHCAGYLLFAPPDTLSTLQPAVCQEMDL